MWPNDRILMSKFFIYLTKSYCRILGWKSHWWCFSRRCDADEPFCATTAYCERDAFCRTCCVRWVGCRRAGRTSSSRSLLLWDVHVLTVAARVSPSLLRWDTVRDVWCPAPNFTLFVSCSQSFVWRKLSLYPEQLMLSGYLLLKIIIKQIGRYCCFLYLVKRSTALRAHRFVLIRTYISC